MDETAVGRKSTYVGRVRPFLEREVVVEAEFKRLRKAVLKVSSCRVP